jgi:hypothetical protein
MASRKVLNAVNLEALGASRLAEVILDLTKNDADAKRYLRLELAGAQGSGEVTKEIRKRLATIARSHSIVDWDKTGKFVKELEFQHVSIVERVAPDNPTEALELMWRFIALSWSVFERCDDGNGDLVGVFHFAIEDLGEIALAANPEPTILADHVFDALLENDYGQFDYLIRSTAPALGPLGLDHLKQRIIALSKEPVTIPDPDDRQIIGYGSGGAYYADEYAASRRKNTVDLALQELADAQGDVDAFIEQQSETSKTMPAVAAEIASRLLGAGRTDEAWTAINAVDEDRGGWAPFEWEQVKIDVLEELGREGDAQRLRWSFFEKTLSQTHLRAFLKKLPDFDDEEAEERAFAHALQYSSIHQSLSFLISWPSTVNAANLVLSRTEELDGNYYEVLTPAADLLEENHPLASTLLRRALIDYTLKKARSTRYKHAARHLKKCEALSKSIDNFGSYETHEAYRIRIKSENSRKVRFWSLVNA